MQAGRPGRMQAPGLLGACRRPGSWAHAGARALGRMRTMQERRPAGLTTSASSTTTTSTACEDSRPAFFAEEFLRLAARHRSAARAGRVRLATGSAGLRRAFALHCSRAAVAICGPFDSIIFYRQMAIRVVAVAIRGAQKPIALSRYRHIATNESTVADYGVDHQPPTKSSKLILGFQGS